MRTTFEEILGTGSSSGEVAPEGTEKQSGENIPTPAPEPESKPTAKPEESKPIGGGYLKLYEMLSPHTPLTEEEKAKEQKKKRRDEIFSAIGDGVAALSNLYFTTQGAPNMYSGKNTMSEATRVRYDKLLKEREANDTAYLQGAMRAKQADDEAARTERAWRRQLGLDQEKREQRKEEMDYRKQRDKADDDYRRESLKTKKEIADDKIEAEKNKPKGNSGSGGSSNSGNYPTPDGKVFKTKAAAIAHMKTLGYGSPETKIKRSTQYSSQGRKRGYTETTVEPDYEDWYDYINNKIGENPKETNKPQPQTEKPKKRTKPIQVKM